MVGQTISHYTILGKLGEGGMGVVYKAEDTRLKRTVALKFLPTHLTSDEGAKIRFIQEAQAASALQHPNICTIHDIEESDDGQLFIAMDCYDGKTLKETIEGEPLSLEKTVDIALQIAKGLSEAHAHGIVHRDIKLANILITSRGEVKIMDFGLAKLSGQAGVTRSGSTVGTIAYMSPEQLSGAVVDERADVWALGVVTYEMWTQRLPFKGLHAAALMYSIANDSPLDATLFRGDASGGLQEFFRRCLAKNPEDRPRTMEEAARILRDALKVKGRSPHEWRFGRTGRFIVAGLLLSLGVVLCARFFLLRGEKTGESQRWMIAVLPFRNHTANAATVQWNALIQESLSRQLTGVSQLAVFDPLSFNNELRSSIGGFVSTSDIFYDYVQTKGREGPSYIITGIIDSLPEGYRIQASITDVDTKELIFTLPVRTISTENEVLSSCAIFAKDIVGFFQVKGLLSGREQDLQSWLNQRGQNIEAERAFLEASRCFFKNLPGYEDYLNRAIQLDSTFVSPRVWLTSWLVQKGKPDKAEHEYRSLRLLDSAATPFEKAMIRWTRAFLDQDTLGQMRSLELALEYSPRNYILLINLAYVQYKTNDFERVIETIRPALESKWEYPPMYALVGRCYIKLGKYRESKDLLVESLNLKPVHRLAFGMLASLYAMERDSVVAGRYETLYFKTCAERKIQKAKSQEELGECYLDVGDTAKALGCYRQSLASASPGKEADSYRGRIRSLLR